MEEAVFLRVYAVGDVSSIRHRNLLIPLLVAYGMLPLERIEA